MLIFLLKSIESNLLSSKYLRIFGKILNSHIETTEEGFEGLGISVKQTVQILYVPGILFVKYSFPYSNFILYESLFTLALPQIFLSKQFTPYIKVELNPY